MMPELSLIFIDISCSSYSIQYSAKIEELIIVTSGITISNKLPGQVNSVTTGKQLKLQSRHVEKKKDLFHDT